MTSGKCYNCGVEWEHVTRKPGRSEYCEDCSAAWHCCRNCKFYDEPAPNHCVSMTTEKVSDTEKPNFCDEFVLTNNFTPGQSSDARTQATNRLDDLFGD